MEPIIIGLVVAGVVTHWAQRKGKKRGRQASRVSSRPGAPRPYSPSPSHDSYSSSGSWPGPCDGVSPEREEAPRDYECGHSDNSHSGSDSGSADCGSSDGGGGD